MGGEVTSHQDSTFLYTTPRQTCLGLWLALQDATLENGCLWVRPASHKEPVRRTFKRNPGHFGAALDGAEGGGGDKALPQMVFEDAPGAVASGSGSLEEVVWEGVMPDGSWPPPCDGLFEAGFVPVECKAGDLVVFPGELDHLSLPNYSSASRHTFQLHLIDGPKAGVTWAPENWLQYPQGKAFFKVDC